MSYRKAASAILAISISTLPCYSQWSGRPWAGNTNAPTWQELQRQYQPFRQLVEALQERADVVRATADPEFPPLELVQTWTVDAGSVTNVVGTNQYITVSGFPLNYFGEDVNGVYASETGNPPWVGPGFTLEMSGGQWWIDDFYSDTGPQSSAWFDGWEMTPVPGRTVSQAPGIRRDLLVTNIVTTNVFGPFPFEVTINGVTHSGTGFPHLTYAAMEWIDLAITDLAPYFVPATYADNPAEASRLIMDSWGWALGGPFSLIGSAGVGRTESGVDEDDLPWVVSVYTRQPLITNVWVLGEWVYSGSNDWVRTVGPLNSSFDMMYPMTYLQRTGPTVTMVSTSASPPAVTAYITGQYRVDHWHDAELRAGSEAATSGEMCDQLWHTISAATFSTNSAFMTGDVVRISYDGPIALYGERPYRLYASDFDERAAVIDSLRYMLAPVKTAPLAAATNSYAPLWTNIQFTGGTSYYEVVCAEDDPDHPAWSTVVPVPENFEGEIAGEPALAYAWTLYDVERGHIEGIDIAYPPDDPRRFLPDDTNWVRSLAYQRSGELVHQFTVNTNAVLGTNFPSRFRLLTYCLSYGLGGSGLFSDYTMPPIIDGQPAYYPYEVTSGGVTTTNDLWAWVVAREHSVSNGTAEYASGRIGHTNWISGATPGSMPTRLYGGQQRHYQDVTSIEQDETMSVVWDHGWRPWRPFVTWPTDPAEVYGIRALVDWGVEGGFRYK